MTAGNQTPPGGRSDAPVGPGQAPESAVRTGTPADDRSDDDRSGAGDPAAPGEPPAPIPPVVPARVTLRSQDPHGSAAPPSSMPPGRGGQSAPAQADQGAHGSPSELFDPSRPAGRAQPPEPADRFPASQLFEPFTPVTPTGPRSAPGAVPGPAVPWSPAPPADAVSATGPANALTPASTEDGSAPAGTTGRDDTRADSPADGTGTTAASGTPSRSGPAADGEDGATPAPSRGATESSAAQENGSEAPEASGAPPLRSLSGSDTASGPQGGPATAPPRTPPPGTRPPPQTPPPPPPVPAQVPMQPRRSAGGPATPPPAPAAPAATGRLRRLPVVLLVVAVFVAGLGYVGYRQLTGGPPEGFRTATSPGYELAVPQTWTPPAPGTPPLTVFGVPFGVAGQYGEYGCRDGRFTRAVAASALIAVPANVGLDQAATAFARGAGEALYPGAGPQVAVGTPGERQLSTVTGSRVEATVRTDGSAGCRATDATVQVLVMPRTTAADGSIGAAVLLVSGDLRGGPPTPAPLSRDQLVGVLDTAVLSGG